MIEGLKVTIVGEELKTLCLKRADFHLERARFYENQKKALPEIEDVSDLPPLSNSKKPREMMQDRIDSHNDDAGELQFIAAHLEPSEHYLLDRTDLGRLGIVKGHRW